jgi:hypothetical protein
MAKHLIKKIEIPAGTDIFILDLEAESVARQQADEALQSGKENVGVAAGLVATEATARQTADNTLAQTVSDLSSALTVVQNWKSAMTDADSDSVINTLTELLDLAKNVPEGADLAALLAEKVSKSDIVNNLTSVLTNVPLSAYQGNVLKGLIDTLTTNLSNHTGDTAIHITAEERTSWNAKQAALNFTPENSANKSIPSGYAALDANGKVPEAQLPASALGVTKTQIIAALGYVPEDEAKKYAPGGYPGLDINQKISLANIPDGILEQYYAYGVTKQFNEETYTLDRIGNLSLHQSLPIQSKMKGCLLDEYGNVIEYLPPDSWVGQTLDGSKGQVMVEIPEYYCKFTTTDTSMTMMISELPLPGYTRNKKRYISAYEASINRGSGVLSSVVNGSANYRGGDNTSAWDGTYRSLLGMPVTNMSRTEFRNAARLRGSTQENSCAWNCLDYSLYKDICWLFYIEYSTLNSQLPFSSKINGYSYGGLGDGVTTMVDWGTYNNYNPIVPCGATNFVGATSGEVACQVGNTTQYVKANRYRGIENPFGHVWKWTDGVNIQVSGGVAKAYISETPATYSDSLYEGYTNVGTIASTEGYVKRILDNAKGCILPKEVGGSSSSYWCDYHWGNTAPDGLRGLLVGGGADDGVAAGLACSKSNDAPSVAGALVGSRLCFIP